MQKQIGRPTDYTEEKANDICKMLANGMTLLAICQLPDMPEMTTVHRWMDNFPEFQSNYAHARKLQADAMAEMVITEAFNSHDAPIGRLRMDALRWFASKMAPKKYGDKVEIESNTNQNFKISFNVPDRDTRDSLKELNAPPVSIAPLPEPETLEAEIVE